MSKSYDDGVLLKLKLYMQNHLFLIPKKNKDQLKMQLYMYLDFHTF